MLKETKKRTIMMSILLFIIILVVGYHVYCHYLVNQLYKCIESDDTQGALVCIEKMPNVNMLDTCLPIYYIRGVFTQNAANKGYPIYYAVREKADVSVVNALLEKGADPNKKEPQYDGAALSCLCNNPQKNMREKTRLLMEYGADIDSAHIYIPTPWNTIPEESKEEIVETTIYLWECGVDEWQYIDTKYERSILHILAERVDVEYLDKIYNNEKRPMNDLLNALDANGETPLFYAVREGKIDNCAFLIEEGADINIKNNAGKTAYDIAIELESDENLEEILNVKEK